jgi:hypothetical protein
MMNFATDEEEDSDELLFGNINFGQIECLTNDELFAFLDTDQLGNNE